MTALYLADVSVTAFPMPASRFPPEIQDSPHAPLMIDSVARRNGKPKPAVTKGLVVHASNNLASGSIRRLAVAANAPALIYTMKSTGPNGQERSVINSYTVAAGLDEIDTTSWWSAVVGLVSEVNPDLLVPPETLEQTILQVG